VAEKGSVTLVHADNGAHLTRWTVTRGKVTIANEEPKKAPARVAASVRQRFDAKRQEIAERYEALSYEEPGRFARISAKLVS
jgi:hypothetical protein